MEINGYPDYLVYEDGRVFSKKRRKMVKSIIKKHGYHQVGLYKDGKPKYYLVHRLVALHYIPNSENKSFVDHIDRNKLNNHVSNLRWVTRSENNQNTNVMKKNKLGIKNMFYDYDHERYCYKKIIRGKCHKKRFKTLEEAITYKEEYESQKQPA